MKVTTILFKIFQAFISFTLFLLACGGLFCIYYESSHFYDNLFTDKDKIECIVDSYRNSTSIDTNLSNYKIEFKDSKLYISTQTCKSVCKFDDNGKLLEPAYTLVKKPYVLYILGYLFFIFVLVFSNDIIYGDNDKLENKS